MKLTGNKKRAGISVDLDNEWSYLKTHQASGWELFPSYFELLIPRLLSLFDEINLRATFFIVGKDAALEKNKEALRLIGKSAHDVGNHSFLHQHLNPSCSKEEIRKDLLRAEERIEQATGKKPSGFRAPGYSWNRRLVEVLGEEGYLYDASPLPTYIGPLARTYYFWKSELSGGERKERRRLFGNPKDGLLSLRPFLWELSGEKKVVEIPVTTFPFLKVPFHMSYLLFLSNVSESLMLAYLNAALSLCRLTAIEPSFLFHSLDFLDCEEVPELRFFPGMNIWHRRKIKLFRKVVKVLSGYFALLSLDSFAESLLRKAKIHPFPRGVE